MVCCAVLWCAVVCCGVVCCAVLEVATEKQSRHHIAGPTVDYLNVIVSASSIIVSRAVSVSCLDRNCGSRFYPPDMGRMHGPGVA